MLHILYAIVGFIIAIAILVTVHEFGHFWVARKCGVKVLRFSIGFGKPLWKHVSKVDGTEYVIAMIPLGGYVSMLGEADSTKDQINDENRDQAYNEKTVYRRMAITLAGPAANFIFAILAFWLMYIVGIPGIKPWVANVEPDSYAWKAGIRPGAYITEVENDKAQTWNMVRYRILTALVRKQKVDLKVRDKNRKVATYTLDFTRSKYVLGPKSQSPLREAGFRVGLPLTVGKVVAGFPAHKAGMRPGDRIKAVNGRPVEYFQQLNAVVNENTTGPFIFDVQRKDKQVSLRIELTAAQLKPKQVGLIGVMLERQSNRVHKVLSGGAAKKAGIRPGDRIVKINTRPVADIRDLIKTVSKSPGIPVVMEIDREGKIFKYSLTPKSTTRPVNLFRVLGVFPASETTKEIYGFFKALAVGNWKTWDMSLLTVQVFGKIIAGAASTENVSGPVRIANVAGSAAQRGFEWYLYILAIISLSLGVINLMPVPVLDGGHFMFQLVELVTGKPVSDKVKVVGMFIGLLLILLLMILAFYNDFNWLLGAKHG